MIQQFIDEGLLRVVVVDLGGIRRPDATAAPATIAPPRCDRGDLRKGSGRRHPLSGPDEHGRRILETVAELVGGSGTATPEQVTGAIERAFGGDPGLLVRFMGTLREALPAETAIVLRGSAVSGHSYTTAEPFDGAGPGTSDLDIVVIGPGAISTSTIQKRDCSAASTRCRSPITTRGPLLPSTPPVGSARRWSGVR